MYDDEITAAQRLLPLAYVLILYFLATTLITHSFQHKERQNSPHKARPILHPQITLKCHTWSHLLKMEKSARYNFTLFKGVRKTRERERWKEAELGPHKCRWQRDSKEASLLACGKAWEQKHEHPSGCCWIEFPLGIQGKQASPLCLCCSTRYIIRISPPSYPTVCTQSKQLRLFFMPRKELESFSGYSASTWYTMLKRRQRVLECYLDLAPEISGALSCLVTTVVTIFTAGSQRVIVDLNPQSDQMTLGARNTN